MKVCLVTPEYPGCGRSWGVGRSVQTIATALRHSGCDVSVLAVTESGNFIEDAHLELIQATRCAAVLRPLRMARSIDEHLARIRPAVVEFQNWGGLGAWIRWRGPRVVRLSTPVARIEPRDRLRGAMLPIHRLHEHRTVASADLLIANSRCMADLAAEVYGRQARLIIPHAYIGALRPGVVGGEAVLYVGRLERRKGVDTLLAAWRAVQRVRPQAVLHLVGEVVDPTICADAPPGVRIHGALGDQALAELRSQCGIQAVPSRFESFGIVVLEAWAGGQAVVACAGGALPDVVDRAGLLAPVEDAPALAAHLVRLLGDEAQRRSYQRRGRERLERVFSGERLAQRTLGAYRAAIRSRRSGTDRHPQDGSAEARQHRSRGM